MSQKFADYKVKNAELEAQSQLPIHIGKFAVFKLLFDLNLFILI